MRKVGRRLKNALLPLVAGLGSVVSINADDFIRISSTDNDNHNNIGGGQTTLNHQAGFPDLGFPSSENFDQFLDGTLKEGSNHLNSSVFPHWLDAFTVTADDAKVQSDVRPVASDTDFNGSLFMNGVSQSSFDLSGTSLKVSFDSFEANKDYSIAVNIPANFTASGQAFSTNVVLNPSVTTDIPLPNLEGIQVGSANAYGSFVFSRADKNNAPTVANAIPDQSGSYGSSFGYTVPANTFNDADGDTLSYGASGMPPGVSFNSSSREFSGTPTSSGLYNINVVASDGSASVTNMFDINIGKAPLTVRGQDATRGYGATNPSLGYTLENFVNGDDASVVTGSANVSTTATQGSNIGSYAVSVGAGSLSAANYNFTNLVNGSLNVTNVPLNVVVDDQTRGYGDQNPMFTGSLTGVVNGDNITKNFSTSADQTTGVGTNVISGNLNDPDNKLGNYLVNIANGELVITNVPLQAVVGSTNMTYGENFPGVPVALNGVKNNDAFQVGVSTGASSTSDVGVSNIVANVSGDRLTNYTFSSIPGSVSINKRGLNVNVADASKTYREENPSFGYSFNGFVNGDNTGVISGMPLLSTTATQESGVGNYAINGAEGSLDAINYSFTNFNSGVLTVGKKDLTLNVDSKNKVYGSANPEFGGSLTGLVEGDNVGVSFSSTADQNSGVGVYPINGSLTGSVLSNYNETINPGQLSVAAKGLNLTVSNTNRVYGDTNPEFTSSLTGVVPGDNVNVSYSTSADTNSPVGSHSVFGFLDGDTNNYAINIQNGSMLINRANLSVNADDAARVYGETNPMFGGSVVGLKNGGDGITASFSSSATQASDAGSYTISGSLIDPSNRLGNYNVTYNDETLLITKANLEARAGSTNVNYGANVPSLGVNLNGVKNSDVFTTSVSHNVTSNTDVGVYPTTPQVSGVKLHNYNLTNINGQITVGEKALTLDIDSQTRGYGDTNAPLTGSLIGVVNGDNVGFNLDTVAGTNSPVGSYNITGSLTGATNNYAMTINNGLLNVTNAPLDVIRGDEVRGYGDTNQIPIYSFTGFKNGEDASVVSGHASLGSQPGSTASIGNYPLTIGQGSLFATNYFFRNFAGGNLNITNVPLEVVAGSTNMTYGDALPGLNVAVSGAKNGETFQTSVTTGAGPTANVGTYQAVPNILGSTLSNYLLTKSNGVVQIGPKALALNIDSQTREYGETNAPLTGSLVGLVNGDSFGMTLETSANQNSSVGNYPATGSVNGDTSNYNVGVNPGNVQVKKAPLDVSVDGQSREYGNTNEAFGFSFSGFKNGEDASVISGNPEITTSAGQTNGVGSYGINIGPGTLNVQNYFFDNFNTNVLNITNAPLTLRVADAAKVYGAQLPNFNYALEGFKLGQGQEVVSGTPELTTTAQTNSPVGTYPITGAPGTLNPTNYLVANFVDGELNVMAKGLELVVSNTNRIYGDQNPEFTGSLTGVVPGDNVGFNLDTVAGTNSPVGNYPIVGSLFGDTNNYAINIQNGMLGISERALTLNVDNKVREYGLENPGFTGTLEGVANGDSIGINFDSSADINSGIGAHPIVGSLSGQTNNYAISINNGELMINKAGLEAIAGSTNMIYGSAFPGLGVTLNGVRAGDSFQTSVSTDASSTANVGSHVTTPNVSGDALTNYVLTKVNGEVTISPRNLLLSIDNKSREYGLGNPALTGSLTGLVNGDNVGFNLQTSADTNSNVGSYPITGSAFGNTNNYALNVDNGLLDVDKAPLTLIAGNQDREYGETNQLFGFNLSGFRVGDDSSVVSGEPNLTSIANQNSPVGVYQIDSAAGSLSAQNYLVAGFVDGELRVNQAPLNVRIGNAARGYGKTNPVVSHSIEGFKLGEDEGVVSGEPNITVHANTNSPVGTYPITGEKGSLSSSNYFFNQFIDGGLTIAAQALTLNVDNQTREYGETNRLFSSTLEGVLGGDVINVSYSTSADQTTGVGTYPIFGFLDGDTNNYAIAINNGQLAVAQAPLEVQVGSTNMTYGDAVPNLGINVTGVKNNDSFQTSVSTEASPTANVGNYPAVAEITGNKLTNYNVTKVPGNIAIGKANLEVRRDGGLMTYGDTNFVPSYTFTGFKNGDGQEVVDGHADFGSLSNGLSFAQLDVGSYFPSIGKGTLNATNYDFGPFVFGQLLVNHAPLRAEAGSTNVTYGQVIPSLDVLLTGARNGDSFQTSVSHGVTQGTGVGNYPTAAEVSGDKLSNYALSKVPGNVAIQPANLVMNADNASKVYGDTNPLLSGSVIGLVPGDGVGVSFATHALNGSFAGNYDIFPVISDSQGNLTNYNAVTNVGNLNVARAPLVISAENKSRRASEADVGLTALVSGLKAGDTETNLNGTLNLSSPGTSQSAQPGSHVISVSGLSSPNYDVTFVPGQYDVLHDNRPATIETVRYDGTNVVIDAKVFAKDGPFNAEIYRSTDGFQTWVPTGVRTNVNASGTNEFENVQMTVPASESKAYYQILSSPVGSNN